MSHDIIDILCAVSPGYSITDFNITSMSVKNQVEQSLKRYEYETTPTAIHNLPTKQDIINLLASQGHWITTQPDLQVNMFVICSISLLLSLSLSLYCSLSLCLSLSLFLSLSRLLSFSLAFSS